MLQKLIFRVDEPEAIWKALYVSQMADCKASLIHTAEPSTSTHFEGGDLLYVMCMIVCVAVYAALLIDIIVLFEL